MRIERNCHVVSRDEASKINSSFTGTYWRVECEEFSKDGPEKSVLAWLNDLHLFIPFERIYHGQVRPVAITNVEVLR